MPDKTPEGYVAVSGLPGMWYSDDTVDSRLALVPGFPLRASIAAYPSHAVPTAGTSGCFPSSPTCLFPHARTKGLRRTFNTLAIPGISRVAFGVR